jgi:hypothetical protein
MMDGGNAPRLVSCPDRASAYDPSMFDTIRSLLRRGPASRAKDRPYPESRWNVRADDETTSVTDIEGQSRSVAFADLMGVAIETNDSGPWGADLWWMLFSDVGKLALTWPQGATGETEAIARLTALQGFDHQAMVAAMACTDNATFVVWQRETRA